MNKKLVKIIPITLCMFLTFTSCSEKENKISSEVSVAIQKEATEATEEKQIDKSKNNKKIADIYTKVLDNIDTYTFVEYGEEGNITYSYDLVNTNSSDIPQLVVLQNTDYGLANIKIFSPDDAFTKEITSDEIYPIGVASAGALEQTSHKVKIVMHYYIQVSQQEQASQQKKRSPHPLEVII